MQDVGVVIRQHFPILQKRSEDHHTRAGVDSLLLLRVERAELFHGRVPARSSGHDPTMDLTNGGIAM